MPALRPLLVLLLLLPLAQPVEAGAPAAPTLVAHSADRAPVVDGRLDEEAWHGVPAMTLDGGLIKLPKVHVYALIAQDALFVGVHWLELPSATAEPGALGLPALTVTLQSSPPQSWTWTGDAATPNPGAEVAGCCANEGCSVELTRPLVAAEGRAALLPAAGLVLAFELRTRAGATLRDEVVLRRGAAPVAWTFEDDVPGRGAAGLRAALGGKGEPPAWVVRSVETSRGTSRVLVQERQDQTDARFPLALVEGITARDVDLSVRFQTRDGWKDRAAGLVWRAKDASNHYILRANALEGNVVLYKMQDGLRVDVPPVGRESDYGVKVAVDPAAWHTLRVVAVGSRFEAYFDGRRLFHVVDATFPEAGAVGLWTKSDSVTAFDDLTLVALDAPAAAR